MNWHAIGAIGQILGSLAVFVTIGFLAVQVHDTKTEMQRAIAEGRTERATQYNMTLATNERLAGIHIKANNALVGDKDRPPFLEAATKQLGLTLAEALMLHMNLLVRWQITAQGIQYADELPQGDRVQFESGLRTGVEEPAFLFWYQLQKPLLNPDAVRYMDNLLAQPK